MNTMREIDPLLYVLVRALRALPLELESTFSSSEDSDMEEGPNVTFTERCEPR